MRSYSPISRPPAALFALCFCTAMTVFAEVPARIGYHGRLLDGAGNPLSTNVWVDVRLYTDAVSGGTIYEETLGAIPVNNGLYQFNFGAPSLLDVNLGSHAEVWMEVHINGDPLSPRQRLVSVPYALHAASADTLPPGAVTSNLLADLSVTAGKIAPGAISPEVLSDFPWGLTETGAALRVSARGARYAYADITQAWASVQSGDVLYVLPGTNLVAAGAAADRATLPQAPLTLKGLRDVSIIGLGDATLHANNEGHHLVFADCTNVIVRNLTLSGERTPVNLHTYGGICLVDNVRQMIIDGCTFRDLPNHGIITKHTSTAKHSEQVTIRDCTFLRGGTLLHGGIGQADGAAIADLGSQWRVLNNDIVDWVRGVEIFANHHKVDVVDILVADNRIYNAGDNALMIINGKRETQIRNVVIRNNQFRGMFRNAINIRAGRDLLIEGNQIDGGGAGYRGIYLHTTFALANVAVRNNQITQMSSNGILLSRTSSGATNIVVADNMIWECGYHGIELPDSGCIVENNTLLNNGWNGNYRSGVLLASTPASGRPTVVRHNWIANNDTSNTKYGIRVPASSTQQVLVVCNTLQGIATADYVIDSTHAHVVKCDGKDFEAGDISATGVLSGNGAGLSNLNVAALQGMQAGRIVIGPGANPTEVSQVFPTPFPTPPYVVATPRIAETGAAFAVTVTSATPSNFTASVSTLDGTHWTGSLEMDWIALGL